MNGWVRRGAVALTVLVASASAAFVTLAETGDRKLQLEVAVAPLKEKNEVDLRALYLYLRSLPSSD